MSLQNTSSLASPSIVNVASSHSQKHAQSETVICQDSQLPTDKEKESDSQLPTDKEKEPDSQLPTDKEKKSDSQLQRESDPWVHIKRVIIQPVYKCMACTHETLTFNMSRLHATQCVTGVSHHYYRKTYASIMCREEYSTHQPLVFHYVKKHAAVQCIGCNLYFVSLRGDATYLVSDYRNFRYQCQFCHVWKLTITEIKRHCVEKHETRSCFYQVRTFCCQYCEAEPSTVSY